MAWPAALPTPCLCQAHSHAGHSPGRSWRPPSDRLAGRLQAGVSQRLKNGVCLSPSLSPGLLLPSLHCSRGPAPPPGACAPAAGGLRRVRREATSSGRRVHCGLPGPPLVHWVQGWRGAQQACGQPGTPPHGPVHIECLPLGFFRPVVPATPTCPGWVPDPPWPWRWARGGRVGGVRGWGWRGLRPGLGLGGYCWRPAWGPALGAHAGRGGGGSIW